jgi:hypothetical protein
MQFSDGHEKGTVSVEANDLGQHTFATWTVYLTDGPDRDPDASRFKDQSRHSGQRADAFQWQRSAVVIPKMVQESLPALGPRRALEWAGAHQNWSSLFSGHWVTS